MGLCTDSFGILESVADFHAFDGLNRHDCECEFCFETTIPLDETAKTNRKIECNNFQHAAESIFAVDSLFDLGAHFFSGGFDWATNIRLFGAGEAFFIRHVAKIRGDFADR